MAFGQQPEIDAGRMVRSGSTTSSEIEKDYLGRCFKCTNLSSIMTMCLTVTSRSSFLYCPAVLRLAQLVYFG